jgi:hypothetical protein
VRVRVTASSSACRPEQRRASRGQREHSVHVRVTTSGSLFRPEQRRACQGQREHSVRVRDSTIRILLNHDGLYFY